MDTAQISALVGAVLLAAVVRFLNIVLEWLARVLGTKQPPPIEAPHNPFADTDETGQPPATT